MQQNITIKHGVTGTSDSTVRNELYEQLVSLIDLILDGRKCHLESIRGTEKFEILLKQYETDRSNLIQPLSKTHLISFLLLITSQFSVCITIVMIIRVQTYFYSKGRAVR